MATFNIRNNNSPAPQAKAAPGTVDLFLKVKDGVPALLGVNEYGKVARLAQFPGDGAIHIRPENDFFQGIEVDDDGCWVVEFDDLEEEVEMAASASPVDYSDLEAATNAIAQAVAALGAAVARLRGN